MKGCASQNRIFALERGFCISSSRPYSDFGMNSIEWSSNDFDDRFDHSILGFEIQSSKDMGQNGFFFHLGKLLTDTISRASGKWNVGIGMSLPKYDNYSL